MTPLERKLTTLYIFESRRKEISIALQKERENNAIRYYFTGPDGVERVFAEIIPSHDDPSIPLLFFNIPSGFPVKIDVIKGFVTWFKELTTE